MACTFELKRNENNGYNKVVDYMRLAKLRCKGEKYVEYIYEKMGLHPDWTLDDGKKHLLPLFEFPEV